MSTPDPTPPVQDPATPDAQPPTETVEEVVVAEDEFEEAKYPPSRRPAILQHFPKGKLSRKQIPDFIDPLEYDPILGVRFHKGLAEAYYAKDLKLLGKYLLPVYVREDEAAKEGQNEYRRDQVVLIIGGVVATGLAALPAAADAKIWSFAAAAASAFLAAWASRSKDLASQERWRTSRLRAELLRGEYFLFLGGAQPYDDPHCRTRNLKRRVAEILGGGAT